jgi:phosphohistidine phosphatase
MRRLMLLRHAKSDWSAPGGRDLDRPLSARGREAAPKMGAYMARHALVPDLIISSPGGGGGGPLGGVGYFHLI